MSISVVHDSTDVNVQCNEGKKFLKENQIESHGNRDKENT